MLVTVEANDVRAIRYLATDKLLVGHFDNVTVRPVGVVCGADNRYNVGQHHL